MEGIKANKLVALKYSTSKKERLVRAITYLRKHDSREGPDESFFGFLLIFLVFEVYYESITAFTKTKKLPRTSSRI